MLRIFLLSLLFIWLFRFVMRYVLPAFRITSDLRRQMKNMHQNGQQSNSGSSIPRPPERARKGDYIEFEEVK